MARRTGSDPRGIPNRVGLALRQRGCRCGRPASARHGRHSRRCSGADASRGDGKRSRRDHRPYAHVTTVLAGRRQLPMATYGGLVGNPHRPCWPPPNACPASCAVCSLHPPASPDGLHVVLCRRARSAHTTSLIRHPTRAPRVRDVAAAWRLSIFTTALTILIGAALWTVTPGETPVRFVRVTLQLLAALTLHTCFSTLGLHVEKGPMRRALLVVPTRACKEAVPMNAGG